MIKRAYTFLMDDLNAVDCFAALGHPTRLTVYRALVQAGDDGAAMGTLQETLGIPASTLSHHVQALVYAGLVHQERRGRTLITRADYVAMRGLIDFLTDDCCRGLGQDVAEGIGAMGDAEDE